MLILYNFYMILLFLKVVYCPVVSSRFHYIDVEGFNEILSMEMDDLVTDYFLELEKAITTMSACGAKNDWKTIQDIAHSQTGASAVMGASTITAICEYLKKHFNLPIVVTPPPETKREQHKEPFQEYKVELATQLQFLVNAIEPTKKEFEKARSLWYEEHRNDNNKA
ncbi:MAG: Hpt domain-containing protein [Sphingobacteriaceae bacterium]|nr:MAG: Hpt domain-containing protein [Sphingobacteriaceae bacterium]